MSGPSFPILGFVRISKLWVAHSARCSQSGNEECRGFLVLSRLCLLCEAHVLTWNGGSLIGIIRIEILFWRVAHIAATHPPNIAESGAPSSWVHQRRSRAQSSG